MTYKIACHTLFDITETGVVNRNNPPVNTNVDEWRLKRNTQCNLDTVLQIISLRSQPESITTPVKRIHSSREKSLWGTEYKIQKNTPYWYFEFSILHASVFNNGIEELGSLITDSHNVPMILVGTECRGLISRLNTSIDYKNIHYRILTHDD